MIERILIDLIYRMFRNQFIQGVNNFRPAGVIKCQIEGQTREIG